MMTCVSERSGSASSGVESVACTPHAATNAVAISTRKRFLIDQRMSEASISVHLTRRLRPWRRHQLGFRVQMRVASTGQVVEGTAQARLRVNQKLSRGDDLLSQ